MLSYMFSFHICLAFICLAFIYILLVEILNKKNDFEFEWIKTRIEHQWALLFNTGHPTESLKKNRSWFSLMSPQGGSRPIGEQFGKFWVGELNFWLGEIDELANVISNSANPNINFVNFILTWRTPKLFHFKNGLTPMGENVSLGDVNKICLDDYAHTVIW